MRQSLLGWAETPDVINHRPIREEELATIRMAAAPLVEILQLRRLIRSREEEGTR